MSDLSRQALGLAASVSRSVGNASGIAPLDGSALVPASNLPFASSAIAQALSSTTAIISPGVLGSAIAAYYAAMSLSTSFAFIAPSGGSGAPTWRKIISTDIDFSGGTISLGGNSAGSVVRTLNAAAGTSRLDQYRTAGALRWNIGVTNNAETAIVVLPTSGQGSVSKVVPMASTAGLSVGMQATATGIPLGAIISSIIANTSVTLSLATTTALTAGTNISFCANTGADVIWSAFGDAGAALGAWATLRRSDGRFTITNLQATGGTANVDLTGSTVTPVAGTSSALTSLLMREVWLDAFGAVGDGVTDDLTALTAAQTYLGLRGGVIRLSAKDYYFSKCVLNDYVTLTGSLVIPGQARGSSYNMNYALAGTRILFDGGPLVTATTPANVSLPTSGQGSASNVIPMASTTGLYVGWTVTGTNIPVGSVIKSIVPNTSINLATSSTDNTDVSTTAALAANATLTFSCNQAGDTYMYATSGTYNQGQTGGNFFGDPGILPGTTSTGTSAANFRWNLSAPLAGTISPGTTIYQGRPGIVMGNSSSVKGCMITRKTLSFPPSTVSAAQTELNTWNTHGNGVTMIGYDSEVEHCLIIGFQNGVVVPRMARHRVYRTFMDCYNGLMICSSGDFPYFSDIHIWPFYTGNLTIGNFNLAANGVNPATAQDAANALIGWRAGIGIGCMNNAADAKFHRVFVFGQATDFLINNSNDVTFIDCYADNALVLTTPDAINNGGNPWVTSTGFKITGSCRHVTLIGCQAYSNSLNFQFATYVSDTLVATVRMIGGASCQATIAHYQVVNGGASLTRCTATCGAYVAGTNPATPFVALGPNGGTPGATYIDIDGFEVFAFPSTTQVFVIDASVLPYFSKRGGTVQSSVDAYGNRFVNPTSFLTARSDLSKKSVVIPTTGSTVTMTAGQGRLLLKPAGTLATLTINLPPTPTDGQEVKIGSTQAITALTITAAGATVFAPTTLAALGAISLIYDAATTSWMP